MSVRLIGDKKKFKRMIALMPRNANPVIKKIVGSAQGVAKAEAPVNKGQLRNSIVQFTDSELPDLVTGIQTNLPYAVAVELGFRLPSRPGIGRQTIPLIPIAPLQQWVRLKLGISGKRGRRVAFAIAVKLARDGKEGAFFFQAAEKHVEKNFGKVMKDIGLRIDRTWRGP